jgi:hypothetical protein
MRSPLIKNITPVARTVSEANRDAQYACAIQTFKSDVKLTLDFLWNALIGALVVSIFSLTCVAIVMML